MKIARDPFNVWWQLKESIAIMVKCAIIWWILNGHNPDSNIWGIWWEAPYLKIGDFWAAMIIIWLIKNIYVTLRRYWQWI